MKNEKKKKLPAGLKRLIMTGGGGKSIQFGLEKQSHKLGDRYGPAGRLKKIHTSISNRQYRQKSTQ